MRNAGQVEKLAENSLADGSDLLGFPALNEFKKGLLGPLGLA